MTFLENNGHIAMVDCGLSQGSKDSNEKNRASLPHSPKDVKEVVITHAHLDHSGYLPRLVKKGFRGSIFCTPVTAELIKVILEDSATLSEELDIPLYDLQDVQQTLKLIKPQKWNSEFEFLGMKATLVPAGHILGASSLIIEDAKRVVFSGDLGRRDDFLLPEPLACPPCDVVIMESTYGAKTRKGDMLNELTALLKKIKKEERVGIIASFALARGQVLISEIEEIFRRHPELEVPLYFDSPMMKKVNEIYKRHNALTLHPREMVQSLKSVDSIDFIGQWKTVKKKSGPLLILSSSGMVTGGRIFRSLENWQDDPTAILFLPGYQGENTPGHFLKEGGRTILNTDGMPIVWSGEVLSSEAFSSHADQSELIHWVESSAASKVFLIHGEAVAKEQLQEALKPLFKDVVQLPKKGETINIT